MAKKEYMTKSEFCRAIHTKPSCWIFKYEKEHPMTFWAETENGETIYHSMQGCEHRRFKDMPQYGEIWMSLEMPNYRSLYNTWTTY